MPTGMLPWVFTVICHRHPGVIHWCRTNAALAFRGGWRPSGAGEGCSSYCWVTRLPLWASVSLPVREAQVRSSWRSVSIPRFWDSCDSRDDFPQSPTQSLDILWLSGHIRLLCEHICEAHLPVQKEVGKVPFICTISSAHT